MKVIGSVLALAALLLAGIASTASASVLSVDANFDGLQMVPPNASPAFGTLTATLDDVSGAFSITAGNYNDLLGGANQVFWNTGAAGANGAFIMTLTLDTPGATTGTFSGGGTLTGAQIADMIAGNTYMRVTSTVFPGGEIRGQIGVVPEPASVVLGGFAMLCLAAVAIRQRHSPSTIRTGRAAR